MKIQRVINRIIVHCSATRHGVTPKQIKRDHVQNRGFSDCGYHYIIDSGGTVHHMRPVNKAGAHCKGQNKDSIGICYIGGRDYKGKLHRITPKQKKTLEDTINGIFMTLKKVIPVYGHNYFNKRKECPCLSTASLQLITDTNG